jgi:3-oxoacid CoA-transferase
LPACSVYEYLSVFLFQGVFSVDKEVGLTLTEIADGIGVEDIIAATGCEFAVSADLKPMVQVPVETEDV